MLSKSLLRILPRDCALLLMVSHWMRTTKCLHIICVGGSIKSQSFGIPIPTPNRPDRTETVELIDKCGHLPYDLSTMETRSTHLWVKKQVLWIQLQQKRQQQTDWSYVRGMRCTCGWENLCWAAFPRWCTPRVNSSSNCVLLTTS